MSKELRELLNKLSGLQDEARALMSKDDATTEEIESKTAEIKAMKAKIEAQKAVDDEVTVQGALVTETTPANDLHKQAFLNYLRQRPLTTEMQNSLSSNTGADGGYIIPDDITTAINQLKMTVDNLEQYVNVQPVSRNKGSRTLEKRADSTPFAPLSEYGNPNAMAEMDSPQFDRLSYAIEDYAGFLPVPNDLLDDTDQALESYLRQWIAKKSKATRNSLILTELNALVKTTIADVDGIKEVLNVSLDPAFSVSATIFTNQDGYNYLDKLKDGDGKYLLQPDPTNATGKTLFGRQVVVLSNKTIPTAVAGNVSNVPLIIGDLKEAIVLWDRKQMSVDTTTQGGNAWRTNTTEFRAIEREDVTLWDSEAVVYGQLDINPAV